MPLLPAFVADYPRAIIVPADDSRVRPGVNDAKVFVVHTPEEPVDDNEVTPRWFQVPARVAPNFYPRASTTFYVSGGLGTFGNGDIYQMVPASRCAIANGVTAGRSYPADTNAFLSLNCQSESVELEGFAHSIHLTMRRGGKQWKSTVSLIAFRCAVKRIPIDRAHIIGHYEVSNVRTDPGTQILDQLVEDIKKEGGGVPTPEEWAAHQAANNGHLFAQAVYAQLERTVAKLRQQEFDKSVLFNDREIGVWEILLNRMKTDLHE